MHRWLIGLCLFVSCAVHASQALERGVCVHLWRADVSLAEHEAMLKQGGFSSWRDSLVWASVETTKGVYRMPARYQALQQAIDDSRAEGIRPMLILGYGNPLYEAGGLVTTEAARQGFANYVRWVATRMKGKVRYYEIWNEWNIGWGSTSTPRTIGSVEDYAKVVRIAAKTIHEIDPAAVVVAGGATNSDTAWFSRFAATGVVADIDGVSIHPYNYGKPLWLHTPEAAMAWVDEIQRMMTVANHGKPVSMYITEMGWPNHSKGRTREEVADFLGRFFKLAQDDPHVAGVWWYDLIDDGRDPDNREHHFGLFDIERRPKPAMIKFQEFTRGPGFLAHGVPGQSAGPGTGPAQARPQTRPVIPD